MSIKEYKTGRSPLLGQSNNSLVMLIAINALVFVLLNFLQIVYYLSFTDNSTGEAFFQKQILAWFTFPADTDRLITRPWTILTYMFSHLSFWNLIGTLLWLWGFGFILQDLTGNKKIFSIYLYGGAVGAICFFLSIHLIPAFRQHISQTTDLIGGGSAVMAIAVAATTLAPDYRIFPMINGGIPLWVLTLIFIAFDYATIASSSGGYAIAHLSGALTGYLFIYQLRRGQDWSEWMNNLLNWFNNLFNPDKKRISTSEKLKSVHSNTGTNDKKTSINQQRLDEILDKIHEQGYQMLTDEDKEFLKQASNQDL